MRCDDRCARAVPLTPASPTPPLPGSLGQEDIDEVISRDLHRTFPEHPMFAFEQARPWAGPAAGGGSRLPAPACAWGVAPLPRRCVVTGLAAPWLLQGQQALFNVLKAYALHDMEASVACLAALWPCAGGSLPAGPASPACLCCPRCA